MTNGIRKWFRRLRQPPHIIWQSGFEEGQVIIELRQPLPFIIAALLLVVYLFAPLEEVVLVLAALLLVLGAAWVWARQVALHFHGERNLLYGAVQVGDEMEENFRLENHAFLPVLWAHLEDHSKFPQYEIRTVRVVDTHSKVEWRQRQICTLRGIFTLGPWELHSGDPFGIFRVRRIYGESRPMVVYPPLATIPGELLPHGRQQGDLRPLNQPLAAESILATQTRPYQPGDPLRRLHWRTTARRESPYVKVFDPEAASRIWLVPDLDSAAHLGEGEDSSEETMILLLTALSGQLLGDGREVGLYAAGESPQIVLPQRGPAHLWTLLSALTPLHATQPESFSDVLERSASLISTRDLVIALTPSLAVEWMRTLSQISRSRQGSEAWAYLLDPASFGGQADAQSMLPVLANLGITGRVIRQGDVQPQVGAYGALRRWEFVTFGTGKLIVRNEPRSAEEAMQIAMRRMR